LTLGPNEGPLSGFGLIELIGQNGRFAVMTAYGRELTGSSEADFAKTRCPATGCCGADGEHDRSA
jgi:hypothetical protein